MGAQEVPHLLPHHKGQGAETLPQQGPGVYWVDDDGNIKSKKYNSEEEAYADGPPAGTFSVQMGQDPWSPRSIAVEVFEFHGTGYGSPQEGWEGIVAKADHVHGRMDET